jgi:hypothetical protein
VSDGRRLQRPQGARFVPVSVGVSQPGMPHLLDRHALARAHLHQPGDDRVQQRVQFVFAGRNVGGSGQMVRVREKYLPVVELERVFDVQRNGTVLVKPVMVVVEAEGRRAALLVDELLGQQQVAVKNLEANYQRVSDVSGATIMGDGRVALILDVGALARRGRS